MISAERSFGYPFILVVLCSLLATGCGEARSELALALQVLKEAGGHLLWSVCLWTALAVMLGIALAVGCYQLTRRLGGYPWRWRWARLVHALVLIQLLLVLPLFVGIIGFSEGLLRGSRQALQEGRIIDEYYPRIGQLGADMVGMLDYVSERLASDDTGTLEVRAKQLLSESENLLLHAEAFRNGHRQLDVPRFLGRIELIGEAAVADASSLIRDQALGRFPSWRGGFGEQILDWFLKRLGRSIMGTAGDQLGVRRAGETFIDGLVAAAAAHGDPSTLTHAELSGYLVEAILVRSSLYGLRILTRGNQVAALLPICLALVLPVLLLHGAGFTADRWRGWWPFRRWQKCSDESDEDPDSLDVQPDPDGSVGEGTAPES